MALTVTLATVDIVAKSMQRPCEVHFSFGNNGHFCFPAGLAEYSAYSVSEVTNYKVFDNEVPKKKPTTK